MSFQISDKVVCVDDSDNPDPDIIDSAAVTKGQVYVVRGIEEYEDGIPGLFIVGPCAGFWNYTGEECSWDSLRFRKLSDVKAENVSKRKEKAKP